MHLCLKPTKSELPLSIPSWGFGAARRHHLAMGEKKAWRSSWRSPGCLQEHPAAPQPTAFSQGGLTHEVWQGRGWGTAMPGPPSITLAPSQPAPPSPMAAWGGHRLHPTARALGTRATPSSGHPEQHPAAVQSHRKTTRALPVWKDARRDGTSLPQSAFARLVAFHHFCSKACQCFAGGKTL